MSFSGLDRAAGAPQSSTPARPGAESRSRLQPLQPSQPRRRQHTPDSTTVTTSLLPTSTELFCFIIFPLILIAGSAYSAISPDIRFLPYNPDLQSFEPTHAPSYFALKTNVFNTYFVKFGWFWITTAIAAFAATYPFRTYVLRRYWADAGPELTTFLEGEDDLVGSTVLKLVVQIAIRWTIATVAWMFTTQWFFGPALIDRSFSFTGGSCVAVYDAPSSSSSSADSSLPQLTDSTTIDAFSRQHCKAKGGHWRHGHDISGHVFLLVLGSAMIILELMPYLSFYLSETQPSGGDAAATTVSSSSSYPQSDKRDDDTNSRPRTSGATVTTSTTTSTTTTTTSSQPSIGTGAKFALGVVGLSVWMVLMTATYFHTWVEKLSGLVVALAAVWVTYVLPRAVLPVRAVVGVPGEGEL